jgi:hypothetical protein
MNTAATMSEKIKLLVGDHAFTTTRETLCMRKGSMLEAMFSGRHNIKPEEDGSIFIDRDGEHFKLILNYLRDGNLPSGLSNDTREALAAEAEYYQLEDLVERLTPSPTAQKIVEYKTVTVSFDGSAGHYDMRKHWVSNDRYSKMISADMRSRGNVRHERLYSERKPFRPTSVLT